MWNSQGTFYGSCRPSLEHNTLRLRFNFSTNSYLVIILTSLPGNPWREEVYVEPSSKLHFYQSKCLSLLATSHEFSHPTPCQLWQLWSSRDGWLSSLICKNIEWPGRGLPPEGQAGLSLVWNRTLTFWESCRKAAASEIRGEIWYAAVLEAVNQQRGQASNA